MKILITGGAGYIGSVVTEELVNNGHDVTVVDDLSTGFQSSVVSSADFIRADINETDKLAESLIGTDAVIHLAASSIIKDFSTDPLTCYQNNVGAGLSLLRAMEIADVRKIVFSSSAAVYGDSHSRPITEEDSAIPSNLYGESKLAFERLLKWLDRSGKLRFASLRYFNAAGATERCGESHLPETHLIPNVLSAASGDTDAVEVFGNDYPTFDGTCIRDFVHVADIAKAHVKVLNILDQKSEIYNLGSGTGFSVTQVLDTAERITGQPIPVKSSPRRSGDPAILFASSEKIKSELGWEPEVNNLDMIIESAWNWKIKNPHGYTDRIG